MHPSLLPKYRGSCPIQHAFLNGEQETGVSIIEISKGEFDAGKILYQESIPLDWRNDNFDTVSKKLAIMGGNGLAEVCSDFDGHMSRGITQGECSKAPMIKSEFGKISF